MATFASTNCILTLGSLIFCAGVLLGCSSPRDDPLLSAEELHTPTPMPTPTPLQTSQTTVSPAEPESTTDASSDETEESNEPADLFGFDYNGKVTLAHWEDPAVQMENFIVGYIIVHGMVYETKLAEVAESEYPSALQSGDVDIVLKVPSSEPLLDSDEVINVGSLYGESSTDRIGVRAQLKETAPPVFDLLGKVEADEEVLAGLASQIRGGRVGVSYTVAGMMFLQRHEDVWTTWVSPEVAASVKAAMEEGKTGLKYKCLTVRGETVRHCK